MTDSFSLTDQIAIHQQAAEWLLAGGAFLDPEYAREFCGWLDPSSLRTPELQRYWSAILSGSDPTEAAINAGCYTQVVGKMNQVVSRWEIPSFANVIAQDQFLHASALTLSEMAKAIAGRDSETLRRLSQSILEQSPSKGDQILSAVDVGLEFQAALDDVGTAIVPTGIIPLDRKMGGFDRQSLIIIAGRPGMGKTSAGLQSAVENAKSGQRVIYFSLEMSRRDLWARLACGRAEVDWRKIKAKLATTEEVRLVEQASADLMDELGDRLLIDDKALTTNEDIFRRVSQYRPDLIVVDHLDLVNRQQRGQIREDLRIGNNSRMGKAIAKQFDIPAIYLCQLSRAVEGRENKRPVLSDLRNSGEIEQDADVVAFLYRPDYYEEERESKNVVMCEWWLEKVRNGKAGVKAETMLNLTKQHFYPKTPDENQQHRGRPLPGGNMYIELDENMDEIGVQTS